MYPVQQRPILEVDRQPIAGTFDASVAELAESRLRRSGYPTLANVACVYHEGALILSGRLPSYFLKQMAQTIAGQLQEVDEIVNQVQVVNSTGFRGKHA